MSSWRSWSGGGHCVMRTDWGRALSGLGHWLHCLAQVTWLSQPVDQLLLSRGGGPFRFWMPEVRRLQAPGGRHLTEAWER